jgi:hypothetical protein
MFGCRLDKPRPVDEEIEVALHRLYIGKLGDVPAGHSGQLLRNFHRRSAQMLGKAETGKGVISQRRLRRYFDPGVDLVAFEAGLSGQPCDDLAAKVHLSPPMPAPKSRFLS